MREAAVEADRPGVNAGGRDWFPFALPSSPIKRGLVLCMGLSLLALCPARRSRLLAGDIDDFATLGRSGRWMLAALGWVGARSGRLAMLQPIHRRFWQSREGVLHYGHHENRHSGEFLMHHVDVVDEVCAAAMVHGIESLVEFGCGRGEVLQHFLRTGPFAAGIGVDLSAGLLAIARAATIDPRISYACNDALGWLRVSGKPGCVYLTNGGVYEYFSPERLRELFAHIYGMLRPAIIALVEPLSPDHDLEADTRSRTYGIEQSFSHPYPALLRDAGFSILHQTDYRDGAAQRWLRLIAVAGPTA